MTSLRNFYYSFVYSLDAAIYGLPAMGKTWVTIWIFLFLFPAQILCFGFLNDYLAQAQLVAFLVALVPNVYLMKKYFGLVDLMGFSHLFGFIPVVIIAILRVTVDMFETPKATWENNPGVFAMAMALIICDTISILFDVVDSYHWFTESKHTVIVGPHARRRMGLEGKYLKGQVEIPAMEWLEALRASGFVPPKRSSATSSEVTLS